MLFFNPLLFLRVNPGFVASLPPVRDTQLSKPTKPKYQYIQEALNGSERQITGPGSVNSIQLPSGQLIDWLARYNDVDPRSTCLLRGLHLPEQYISNQTTKITSIAEKYDCRLVPQSVAYLGLNHSNLHTVG